MKMGKHAMNESSKLSTHDSNDLRIRDDRLSYHISLDELQVIREKGINLGNVKVVMFIELVLIHAHTHSSLELNSGRRVFQSKDMNMSAYVLA